MIGKIIADASGLTEKLGGHKNVKFEPIKEIKYRPNIDKSAWDKFQAEVKAADGDTIKIKAAIDDSELQDLKRIDGLYDYAVNQSQNGNDVDLGSVNNLIQAQNYQNIANQAHGILGVKQAIDKYNEGIEQADFDTEKFIETIASSNASLGEYLSGLRNANNQYSQGSLGLRGYATSLVVTTARTFALEAATMVLNT